MYNDNNELLGNPDITFIHDDNGNMVRKTEYGIITSYLYNTDDRLSKIWNGEIGTGTLTVRYYYDPFGRRLWKEVTGLRTYFHYATEGLIGEYDDTSTEIKTYGWKPDSIWSTDPLFIKEGSDLFFSITMIIWEHRKR